MKLSTSVAASSGGGPPAGAMLIWPTDTAPTGYLLCYGQAVSRTTYADLFAVLSTTYGVGDGSTTFNLPDMRGRVPLGQDDMGGSSANVVTAAAADTLGSTGGAETHTLSTGEMPAHTHNITLESSNTLGNYQPHRSGYTGTTYTQDTSSTGSSSAHNNMQPYITLNYIIKT